MTLFHNWSVRRRLILLGFVAVLLPYLALLGVGAAEFQTLTTGVSEIHHEAAVELRLVSAVQIHLNELTDTLERRPVGTDPVARAEIERQLSQFQEAFSEFVNQFTPSDAEERRLVEAAKAEAIAIQTLVLKVTGGDGEKAVQLLQRRESLERVLNRIEATSIREIGEARERISRVVARLKIAALGAVLLSLVGGVLLALLFSRWIGGPIQAIARASRALADGDLSQRVDVRDGGEAGKPAGAFNAMAERLETSYSALRRTNEELAAINSIAGALTSSLEPKQVYRVLTQRTAQAVGAERCSLNLWREGRVVPVMSQFADGHADPALWQKFKAMGPYRPEEVSVHAEAIRTRRPVVIEDATASPLYPADWVETFGVHAALVVPLIRQDQVIGTLNLDQTRGPYRWSQNQIDLAMTIAGQAALAVENVRLYQEARDREREATRLFHGLTLLNRATRALHATLDVESMMSEALKELADAFGAGAALVHVLSETGEIKRRIGHWLSAAHARDVSFRTSGGISALLRQTGQPLVLRDIAERRDIVHPAHFEHGVKSLAGFPIIGKDRRVLGSLLLYYTSPQAFPEGEVRLLAAYAEQLAMALENARLYEESEARRRTSEALAAIGRDLSQSLDLAVVGQRITDGIRQLLGLGYSRLYRLEPESGDLVAVAMSGTVEPALRGTLVFPKGMGAVGLAVRERRLVASEDVLNDPRITLRPELRDRMDPTSRAVLAVPLIAKDAVIGALVVGDGVGRVYQVVETQLVQAFADQAAVALENARLFQEARHALADLKAAQQQLVQGTTMRALGELASGAAHHLNNLMAIVVGRVRLLLDGPESASLRRPLEIIERAAMDATEVVRRVSRFARMKPLEDWQPLDLRQLASEVLELTRARWNDAAQAQGVTIDAVLEGPDLEPVMGNSAGLREVLINLVLNAVEALPTGGKIAVRTFSDDGWVGLAVSDTGVGMPPEVRERVLEPFFTTKGPRSTGLGLSESYGILQRHGGRLTVESAEGHGSTVTVYLPVAPPSESGGARGEPARFAASALRILVIDDDDEVREVVAEMLAAQGHTVLQASGGREGLALLAADEKMALVLTDLGMPGMTGWEVARAVRARWPGLPVGMLTGWGEQIDDASPDRQMVAGVLSKPATPEGLRQFVDACHATSRGI